MPPSREASQAVAGPSKPPKRLSKVSSVPARLVPRSQNAKQKAAAVQSSKELSSLEVASLEDSDDEGSRTSSPFDPETSQTRYDEAHKMLLAKIQTLNGKSRLIDGNVDGADSKAPPNAQVTATELSAESIPSLSTIHTRSEGSGGGDSRLLPPSLASSTNRSEALTRANNLLTERLKNKSPVKAPLQASDSISNAPRAVANELASSPEKVPPPAAPLQQPLLRWEFGLTGMEQASAAAAASASKTAGPDVPEVRYPPQRLQESSSDGQNAKATTSQEVAVSAPNGLDRQAAEKTSSASTLANVLARLFPSKPDAPMTAPNLEGEATRLSNEHAAIAAPTVADQTIEEVLKSQRVKGASNTGGKLDEVMAEVESQSGAPPQGEAEPEPAGQNTSAPAAAPELDSVLTEQVPTGNEQAPAPTESTSAGQNGASGILFPNPKQSMASTSESVFAAPPIPPSDAERPQLHEAEGSSLVNSTAKAPQLEVAASVNPAREENAVEAVVAPTNAFRAAEVSTPPATSDALRTLSQAWGDFDLAAFEEEDFASQLVAVEGGDNVQDEEARMSESVVRDAGEGLPAEPQAIELTASGSKPTGHASSDRKADDNAMEESQPNEESSHLDVEAGADVSAEAVEKSARVKADSMDTGADGGDNGTGKSIQDGSQPPQAIAASVSELRAPTGSTKDGEVEYADASAENAAVQKDERESSNAQNLNETNASSAIASKGQHRAPSSGLASQSLTTAPAPPDAALPSTAAAREDLGFPDDSDMSVLTSKQLIGTAEPQQTDTSQPVLGAANDPQNVDARDDGNIEIHGSAIDAMPPKDGQSATSVRSHANAPERETRILMDESQPVMPPVVTEGMSLPFSMGPETQMHGPSHSDGTQSSESASHEDRNEQPQSVNQSSRDSQDEAAGQGGGDKADRSETEHQNSAANGTVSRRYNHATPERENARNPEADDPWYGRTPPGPRQFVSVQIDIPGPESLESPSESSDESLPPVGPGSRTRRHPVASRTSAPSDARIKSPNAVRQGTVRQTRSSKKHPGTHSAPPARRTSIHTVEEDGKPSSRQQTTLHRFLGQTPSGEHEERPKSNGRSNSSSHGANGSDDSSSSDEHDAAKRPTSRPMPRKRAPRQMAVESQFTQRMELRQSSEGADESQDTPALAVNAAETQSKAQERSHKADSPAGQMKEGVVAQSPPMSAAEAPAEVIVIDDTQSQAVAGHPATVTNATGEDQKDTQDSDIEIAGASDAKKGPAVVAAESAAPPEQLLVLSGSVSTAEALRRLREEQETSKQEQQWLMDNVHPSDRHDAEQAAVAARSGASCTEEEESQGLRQANPERREQAVETTAQNSSSPEPWARPRLAMMMGTAPGRDGERRVANGSSAQMRPLGQFVNELLYPQDDQSRVEGRAKRQEGQSSTEEAVASNGGETPAKASALASASASATGNGETSSSAPGKGQTSSSAPRGTARLASVAMSRADSPSAPKRRRTGYKPMGKEEAKRRLAELTAQIVD
ncbi:unnamed protein product [Jaminaea pallidilutea]